MATIAYALCFVTALGAAILLTRSYRSMHARLLFWSAACFWGLSVANALAFVDLFVFPQYDYYWARLLTHVVSLALLVYGLVWESR